MRIRNVRVVTPDAVHASAAVDLMDGRIAAVHPTAPEPTTAEEAFDGGGGTLLPGFIDMHFHGCLGRDLMEADPDHWQQASEFLAAHGVTGFLATSTSTSPALTDRFLDRARSRLGQALGGAELLGVHMEGPYINPALAGMMPRSCLREPDPADYGPWLASGLVRRLTASLELPGGDTLLSACCRAGTLLSLGHSVCTAEDVRRWADQGLGHVTHLYNAMSRAEKRGPVRIGGCLEGALADRRVAAEIVGDGVHVPEALFRVAALCKGPAGLTVASDATPPTGAVTEGMRVRYGGETGEELVVRNGMALSADEAMLVGAICPLGDMFARILAWLDNDWQAAARAFSTNAAERLGLGDAKGSIAPGWDADLVLVDDRGCVRATWVAGIRVFDAAVAARAASPGAELS